MHARLAFPTSRSCHLASSAAILLALSACDGDVEHAPPADEDPPGLGEQGAACGRSYEVDTSAYDAWTASDDRIFGIASDPPRIESVRIDGLGEHVIPLPDEADELQLVDGWLYVVIGDAIHRVPELGGELEPVVEGIGAVSALHVHAGRALWVEYDRGGDRLFTTSFDRNSILLAEGRRFERLRVGEDRVFFTAESIAGRPEANLIASAAVQGGPPAALIEEVEVIDYLPFDGDLFVVTASEDGAALSIVDDGALTRVATLPAAPVLFDAGFAYVWSDEQTLSRLAVDGSTPLERVHQVDGRGRDFRVVASDDRIFVWRDGERGAEEIDVVCKSVL